MRSFEDELAQAQALYNSDNQQANIQQADNQPEQKQSYDWYDPSAPYGRVSNGNGGYTSEYTYSNSARNLQGMLNKQFGANIAVDGYYGPETAAAVKKYLGGEAGAGTTPYNLANSSPYNYTGFPGFGNSTKTGNPNYIADSAIEGSGNHESAMGAGSGSDIPSSAPRRSFWDLLTGNKSIVGSPKNSSINERLAENMADLVEQGYRTPTQFEQATGISYEDYRRNGLSTSKNSQFETMEDKNLGYKEALERAQQEAQEGTLMGDTYPAMQVASGYNGSPLSLNQQTFMAADPVGAVTPGSDGGIYRAGTQVPEPEEQPKSINERLAENMASLVAQGLRTKEQFKQSTGLDYDEYIGRNEEEGSGSTANGSPDDQEDLYDTYLSQTGQTPTPGRTSLGYPNLQPSGIGPASEPTSSRKNNNVSYHYGPSAPRQSEEQPSADGRINEAVDNWQANRYQRNNLGAQTFSLDSQYDALYNQLSSLGLSASQILDWAQNDAYDVLSPEDAMKFYIYVGNSHR